MSETFTCVNPKCPFYHTDMLGPDGKNYIDYYELEDGYMQPYCIGCGYYAYPKELDTLWH